MLLQITEAPKNKPFCSDRLCLKRVLAHRILPLKYSIIFFTQEAVIFILELKKQRRRWQTWQHDHLRLTSTAVQAPSSVNLFSLWVHTSSHPASRFIQVWRGLSRKHHIDWLIRGLLQFTYCSSMRKSQVEICACQLTGGGINRTLSDVTFWKLMAFPVCRH